MAYYVIRNGSDYGPYDIGAIMTYVENGSILLHDQVRDTSSSTVSTIADVLKKNNIKVKPRNKGTLADQLRSIGSELILPVALFRSRRWLSDKRLILLALIGLGPSVVMLLPVHGFMVFYAVALYFAAIWGLFFFYFFRTDQVNLKTTVSVFFLTQICVYVIWNVLNLPLLNPFYHFVDSVFPLDMLGYVLGVGLTEEFVKLLPLIIIYHYAKAPLQPKTAVFYGLISGIAFGVYEGVEYQTTVNINLDYTSSFFMNIARLTCLPFIHAVWTGIAGYFFAFAKLFPLYRRSLYFLALAVPSALHGLYDTFCGTQLGMLVSLPLMFFAVFLLTTYLKRGMHYQSRLSQTYSKKEY